MVAVYVGNYLQWGVVKKRCDGRHAEGTMQYGKTYDTKGETLDSHQDGMCHLDGEKVSGYSGS